MSIKVYYPFAGRALLFIWSTHNDGTHVMIGRTLSEVRAFALSVSAKYHNDCKFKDLVEVEFVIPPTNWIAQIKQKRIEEEAQAFFHTVIGVCLDAKRPKKLVGCIKACNQNRAGYCGDETGMCKCNGAGYTLVDMTMSDFYAKYYDKWLAAGGRAISKFDSGKELRLSMARAVGEGETIMRAGARFGHHCAGVIMSELDEDNLTADPALFYYVQLFPREQDLKLIQKEVEAAAKEKASIYAKALCAQSNVRQKEVLERRAKLLAVFE